MKRERIDWLINAVFVPLASVAAGFVVAGVAVAATGADPLAAFTALFQGAITNRNAFPETLVSTVPYVFLGLGVALGFRAGLFNIGAEGQAYIGGLGVGLTALWLGGAPLRSGVSAPWPRCAGACQHHADVGDGRFWRGIEARGGGRSRLSLAKIDHHPLVIGRTRGLLDGFR